MHRNFGEDLFLVGIAINQVLEGIVKC